MFIRWIFSIVFIFFGATAFAQVQIQDPLSGRVLSVSKYGGINGNPFLFEKWVEGEVILKQGKYTNLELKYDAFSKTLYFNKNGEMFEFQDEVISFLLMPQKDDKSKPLLFVKGIETSDFGKNQFVQLLHNGRIGLYKSTIVFVSEMNKINEGVVKTFQQSERYYSKINDRLEMIKFSKKDIMAFLADRSAEVEKYATSTSLSFKKEADVIKILEYYESLKKSQF